MQRVLFCLNGPNEVNGPNVWLTRHLPELRNYGILPEVLYLTHYPERECCFRTKLVSDGVACRSFRLNRFLEDNIEMIAGAVSKDPPDVFVPNYSVPAYFASRFLREAGILTVGTLHSDDPYYHDIVDFFVSGPKEWRLSAVVVISDFLSLLIANKTNGNLPYLHAPYGAPIPSAKSKSQSSKFRLIYCGRLVEWQKRVRRVANSMVAAARADMRVEGLIYGEGPEENHLQDELAVADCNNRVRLGGLIAPDKIQSVMLSAHAFVLLSDFEGFSIALMEAMACGLVPILSRMRSGTSDIVIDGVNGFIIEGDDVDAFVSVVRTLANDTVLWQRMSMAARRSIKERGLTSAACAQEWSRFLKDLASRSRQPNPLSVPARETWCLPPRSKRPNGIRSVDRRCVLPKFRAALALGKPVFLWGAGRAGEIFLESVQDLAPSIAGFIDSDTAKHGTHFLGIPIFPPSHLETLLRKSKRPFVMITSQFESEIESSLQKYGMLEDEDYLAS